MNILFLLFIIITTCAQDASLRGRRESNHRARARPQFFLKKTRYVRTTTMRHNNTVTVHYNMVPHRYMIYIPAPAYMFRTYPPYLFDIHHNVVVKQVHPDWYIYIYQLWILEIRIRNAFLMFSTFFSGVVRSRSIRVLNYLVYLYFVRFKTNAICMHKGKTVICTPCDK